MRERIKVTDQEKLTLLYERFRDVCLVEKEVWKEIFMPREVTQGLSERTYKIAMKWKSMIPRSKIHSMQISLAAARPWLPRFRNIERTFHFIEKSEDSAGRKHSLDILDDLWRQRLRAVMVSGDDLS